MKGGALPLLAWGGLMLIHAIGNAVWDQKLVNAAEAFFAVLVILSAAGVLYARGGRRTVQRGAPEPVTEPEPVSSASLGAVLVALSVAMILFGMAWGRFLVDFGAFCLVAALARVTLEVRAERRAVRDARGER